MASAVIFNYVLPYIFVAYSGWAFQTVCHCISFARKAPKQEFHKCSIGFKSGDCARHGKNILIDQKPGETKKIHNLPWSYTKFRSKVLQLFCITQENISMNNTQLMMTSRGVLWEQMKRCASWYHRLGNLCRYQ